MDAGIESPALHWDWDIDWGGFSRGDITGGIIGFSIIFTVLILIIGNFSPALIKRFLRFRWQGENFLSFGFLILMPQFLIFINKKSVKLIS